MKKNKINFLLFSFLILIISNYYANADNKRNELMKMQKQKSAQVLKEYYKTFHSRVPHNIPKPDGIKIPSEIIKNNKNYDNYLASPDSINTILLNAPPIDMVVPGEFEENQAILVAWPYISYDEYGNEVISLFENIGMSYEPYSNRVNYVKIQNIPDLNENSEFANIMLKLINYIQEEVPAWVTVFNLNDTIEIKKYALDKGLPLTNVRFIKAPSNSFWYRDSGPVAFYYDNLNKIGLLDFEYYTGRPLDDNINTYISQFSKYPLLQSSLETEGGNILVDGYGTLFTTTAYRNNNLDTEGQFYIDTNNSLDIRIKTPINGTQIDDSIKYYMNIKKLYVLPTLLHDGGTGHIDLYADMPNENEFVFGKFPQEMSYLTDYKILNKNIDSLLNLTNVHNAKYTAKYIPTPRKNNGKFYTDDKSYEFDTRTFSNHLILNKTIIQPIFNNGINGDIVGDSYAIESIKKAYPGYKIKTIDMRALDGSGGSIHCITKQIPAENPIRISHRLLTPNDLNKTDLSYPLIAKVESNKEIKEVKVFFRYNLYPEWDSLVLVKNNDGLYSANIKCTKTCSEYSQVDYYITAKSDVKIISSPMPAPDGYYTILPSESSVNEAMINQIKIFPNPTSEKIFIEIGNEISNSFNIKIVNESGKEIYNNTINNNDNLPTISINTSILPMGNYFIYINSNDKILSGKFNVIK